MSAERAAKIREYRLKQPRSELARKAAKSASRHHIWMQEELDDAVSYGRELGDWFEQHAE